MDRQSRLLDALTSQVGRKILTGITGALLVLFIILHLAGNLQLISRDPALFNRYAETLHSFGILVWIAEIGLAAVILLHAYIGITIFLRKRRARRLGYAEYRSKGQSSRQSLSSKTMIWTGSILLLFIIIHVAQFRFGPNIDEGYIYALEGNEVRDLYKLTIEVFSQIGWVIFYVGVMLLLGFHLRHGIWSMLQSLGAMKPRWSKGIYTLAFVLGALLAVGFLMLPVWIYVNREHYLASL